MTSVSPDQDESQDPTWDRQDDLQQGEGMLRNDQPKLTVSDTHTTGRRTDSNAATPNAARRKGISKNAINFIVDSLLLLAFMTTLWTTSVVQFVFPAGSQAAGWTLWGFDYDAWCAIQTGAIAWFSLVVLLHLILHWQWVCAFVTSRLSKSTGRRIVLREATKTLYGVGFLIVVLTVLGVLLILAEFQIVPGPH